MKNHHLEWTKPTLDIRCWACGEILFSVSAGQAPIIFNSSADHFEITCPMCHSTCEYSFSENSEDCLLQAHDWDPDIDGIEFKGEAGDEIRELLRGYKSILLSDSRCSEFYGKEFGLVTDYLEYLAKRGLDPKYKSKQIIDHYIEDFRAKEDLSLHREKIFRRAINRFYRVIDACPWIRPVYSRSWP